MDDVQGGACNAMPEGAECSTTPAPAPQGSDCSTAPAAPAAEGSECKAEGAECSTATE